MPSTSPTTTGPGPYLRQVSKFMWRSLRALYYWPGQIATHAVRLSRHPADAWYRITAPWIVNSAYPAIDESHRPAKPESWYRFRHHFTFADEHVRYDIDYARRAGDVKGLALIFFMGAGDYFFTTPLIRALRQKYPDLPIMGFASRNAGEVNSPLVGELIQHNPDINEVRFYDGRQTRRYKNYDYRDALRRTPPGYLALPVLYEHLPHRPHRLISLFETFGLEAPEIAPAPVIPLPAAPAPHLSRLCETIKQQCARHGLRGVVFLQTDSRASHYAYPYTDRLAAGLAERGYFVLSASKLAQPPALSHVLDFYEFAIMDSIHVLALLREALAEMYIVSVASVFWSVSSALGIANLGMQHFSDDAMHNYWYPNITVVTHRDYGRLPPAARFLAAPGDYELTADARAVFAPGFVLECFDKMRNGVRDGSRQEDLAQSFRASVAG